jgi:serine/threonine protein kinase
MKEELTARIIGDYEFQEEIGAGSFASIYKAIHLPSQLTVAIKTIYKEMLSTKTTKTIFGNQIEILKSLHHPFIADFFDSFESRNNYYIVMEYLPNGNLFDYIVKQKKLKENDAKRIFLRLIFVLDYLHNEKHIVHRDLKPQNIMFDKNYNIRIIDFDFCINIQSDTAIQGRCGSPSFTAPEILSGRPYNSKCDIWSTGIILYQMICGKPPFDAPNLKNLFKQIRSSQPHYEGISENLNNLIQSLLQKNPDDRISFQDIQNHPCLFLSNYNKLLTSCVEPVMKIYEELSIENPNDDQILQKYNAVQNRILIKDQITDFLQSSNQL